MISGLVKMIFRFFLIFKRFEKMSGIKDIGIKCLSFGGIVNVENNRGVGRGKGGYFGEAEKEFAKNSDRICRQSMSKKSVENNSVNCPFSVHGVQNLDKTSPFSGHGVHFLDIPI